LQNVVKVVLVINALVWWNCFEFSQQCILCMRKLFQQFINESH